MPSVSGYHYPSSIVTGVGGRWWAYESVIFLEELKSCVKIQALLIRMILTAFLILFMWDLKGYKDTFHFL